jgi:hypothetical protein
MSVRLCFCSGMLRLWYSEAVTTGKSIVRGLTMPVLSVRKLPVNQYSNIVMKLTRTVFQLVENQDTRSQHNKDGNGKHSKAERIRLSSGPKQA